MGDTISTLEHYLTPVGLTKLLAIPNRDVHRFVAKAVDLCEPMKVFVCTDAQEDIDYIRRTAIARGEETELAINTQTVHFDGFFDQARDTGHTQYLVPSGETLGEHLEQIERDTGLKEVRFSSGTSMGVSQLVLIIYPLLLPAPDTVRVLTLATKFNVEILDLNCPHSPIVSHYLEVYYEMLSLFRTQIAVHIF